MSEEKEKYKFCFNDHGLCVSPIDYKTLEMTAKEMFEKLGYKEERGLKTDETTLILYRNDDIWFFFHKVDGEIAFTKYRDVGFFHKPVDITFEELKAINKQVEELGWDNEKI